MIDTLSMTQTYLSFAHVSYGGVVTVNIHLAQAPNFGSPLSKFQYSLSVISVE